MVRDEDVPLSGLIDIINERFGSELTEADQLFFDQLAEAAVLDDALRRAAEANPADKFQLVFREALESLFIERMDLNEALFTKYTNLISIFRLFIQPMISKFAVSNERNSQ